MSTNSDLNISKKIFILTDCSTFGGTYTWTNNFTNVLDILSINYFVTSNPLIDFKFELNCLDEKIIIINNYQHKFFDQIDQKIIQKCKFYFVMHGKENPINSYLIENLKYFNGIICITKEIKEFAEKHNLISHLIFFLLENFVEPVSKSIHPVELAKLSESIELQNPQQNHPNQIVFNFVGRVSPEKNLPMLLYAFCQVQNKHQIFNWQLNIWGNTSNIRHYDMLVEIIKKSSIYDKVKFCGFTNDKNKLYSKNQSDYTYTILPSIYEGSSYAVIESLAYGIPVIAIKGVGDNDYQINHNLNGYLIDLIFATDNLTNQSADQLALLNFNQKLKNVGYFEGVIYKNIKNGKMTLNRNIITLPPIHYNIKSDIFETNINKMTDVIILAINKPLYISPQSKIIKQQYFDSIKTIISH